MLEIVLGVCLTAMSLGLLVYLFLHEKSEQEYIKQIQTSLMNLPIELQKFYADFSAKDNTRTQKMIETSFKDYLRHIEKLERLTLPQPVTTRNVKKVLSRIGEIADESLEIENDIEKEEDKGVELQSDEWTGVINGSTKVAFEDDAPVIVED